MAGHLVRAGFDVTVWNRTAAKAAPLAEAGAMVAENLSTLAQSCEVIMICVSRTEDVEACLNAMLPHAAPGTLFIDHSTISPVGAQALAATAQEAGMRFLDAPITGGSMGAQAGTLTIFVGGAEADYAEAKRYLDTYAKTAEWVGPSGSGQRMKMANQIAVGGALLGLCESLAFAQKAGLDLEQAHRLIGGGAAGSWAFANYGPKILNQDWTPGFSIDNQVKDFVYCEEVAASLEAALPSTQLARELLEQMQAAGHGGDTTARLFELLKELKP